MRKAYILTLLTLLCSIATAWAEFKPEEGKAYALQVKDTSPALYVDITSGNDIPFLDGFQNSITLSTNPCAIYFVEPSWGGEWAIKNGDGKFVFLSGTYNWVPETGGDYTEAYWSFPETKEGSNTFYFSNLWNGTIYGNTDEGAFLYYGSRGEHTPLLFSILDFANLTQEYTFHIGANAPEGVSVTYDGSSVSEGHKINGGFNVNLFVATDIVGYTWEIVVDDENRTITLVYTQVQKYTFHINAPPSENVEITYNGNSVLEGQAFDEGFDVALFNATNVKGYTWSIVVDETQKTITLVYTATNAEENPDVVVALINRIGGAGTSDKFKFVLDPDLNLEKESFMLGSEGDKILIKGTTISAITTGIGWYLNNVARINIAWNSLNEKATGAAYVNLVAANLPLPAAETHTTDAKYRYYLNYCTFGYSMTTWTWERWQKEIDWMALHGVNMPLQIIGLEEVWRKFLTLKDNQGNSKYNYTDVEAKAFVAGPAFTAWWGMNNLEGWGGTGADGWGGVQDDAWYARQQELATRILTLERALGMEPVLPGFSGMVPSNFTDKTGITTDDNGKFWNSFTRPHIIDPKNERFAGIASDYYTCLTEVMGTSQYYSMDPFHEGGSYDGNYGDAYRAIYDAMDAAKSNSQWVIQQWQWWDTERKRQAASLDAVPEGKLIVLDLFSDGMPQFNAYSGYAPQHAVFCAIPNFGGRSGLMGRLQNVTDNYFNFKQQHATIKGIGIAPEAIEQTPITYDLVFQLPWMDSKPNVAEWVANYAVIRYGQENAIVKEAWDLLRQGPLNYGADGIQGPIEDVWAARPNLDGNPSSSWGTTLSTNINNEGETAGDIYTPERRQMLADAVYKLLSQEQALGLAEGSIYESNYLYDLVEFGSAVMADYAHDLLLGIGEARSVGDNALYETRRDAFLQLILDMDAFKGTNLNFRLGKWTEEARAAAEEITDAESATADWYEFNNARTLITTWGDYAQNGNGNWNDGLKDYSYRSWQGLLKDYYYPRWAYYFEHDCTHPDNYFFFEWNWAHGMTHEVGQTAKSATHLSEGDAGYSYSRNPEGNTVALAQTLLDDYIIPVSTGNGTYYAYRYLDNDMTHLFAVVAEAGSSIDLTEWFDAFVDVTITGDIINGTATNLNNVSIVANAAKGEFPVTLTYSDGTVFHIKMIVNPDYYGAYYIHYMDGDSEVPLFIGYNTENDDWGEGEVDHIGYKILGTGAYTTDAEGDKVFTFAPQGEGYTISAQGKTLVAPNFNGWNHIQFSDDKKDAGVYLFIKDPNFEDVFKIQGVGENDNIGTHNDYLQVYGLDVNAPKRLIVGNNPYSVAHSFRFIPATTYSLTIPASGVTTLYLPFNVVLPEGLSASDINEITDNNEAVLVGIAAAGHTLKKGTPVIIKGTPNTDYTLSITMSNANARGSIANSLLRGTYVKQTVTPGDKYQLNANGDGLSPIASNVDITNGCWVEWDGSADNISFVALDYITVGEWKLKFEVNDEGGLTLTEHTQAGENDLVIPATHIIDGVEKSITALADGFLSGTNITSIVLPETLEQMGNLSGCTNLQSVTFTSNPTFNVKDKVGGGVELHLLLDDSKAIDFNTTTTNTFDRITYRRRLPDGVYGSIMLPFTPDTQSMLYYAFYALSSSTSESLIFAEVKSPKPNVPYIYTKRQAGAVADITAGETTIANPGTPNIYSGSWVTVGTYTTHYVECNGGAHYYGISSADNQFYHVRTGGRIKAKPHRAYFKNTDTSSAAVPKLTLRLADGDVAEIVAEDIDGECKGAIYDLLGRPITNPTKGLYIVNGKKVIFQ